MSDDSRTCDYCGDELTTGHVVSEYGDYHAECVEKASQARSGMFSDLF